MARPDPFNARTTLEVGGTSHTWYRLDTLQEQGVGDLSSTPYSIKVLLESCQAAGIDAGHELSDFGLGDQRLRQELDRCEEVLRVGLGPKLQVEDRVGRAAEGLQDGYDLLSVLDVREQLHHVQLGLESQQARRAEQGPRHDGQPGGLRSRPAQKTCPASK